MTAGGGRRPAPLALAAVIGLILAVLAPAIGILPAPQALAANTDLTLVTNATYEVRPDQRLVHVTVKIVATNHLAETTTKKFYFDRAYLAVLPGTSGFKVTGASGAKVVVSKRAATYTLLRIDFGAHLYGGKSQTLSLAFDLKDASSKANAQVRIGGSLASFPVWAFASDGATGSTVTVTFPAGYAASAETGAFDHTLSTPAGGTSLVTDKLAKPLSFFAYVVGERQATYADTSLTVPTNGPRIAITMRAWADDPAWAKRVGGLFAKALPVLAGEIALPWPHPDPLIVQEAVSRTTGGYAGLYDPSASRIEVAYWADSLVAIHEAAHGWFNGTLLADRWAIEGFASLYAQRAAAALKEKDTSPGLTDAVKVAQVPLNAWAQQTGVADRATEAYGYAASLALARAIAERAGDPALQQVWADASAGVGAYQPPDPAAAGGRSFPGGASSSATSSSATSASSQAETVSGPPDWRGLLDLLEARTGKDFTDLWRTWVVRPDEVALLDARAVARTSFSQTLALADGWMLPRAIRDGLRSWQFDAVEPLMADARTVFAQRVAVEARAARNGLKLPDTMRRAFEAGSMADASRVAEAELNAMLTLEGTTAERPAQPDVLTQIGLLGAEPDVDLANARSSFEAGNLDATLTSANAALSTWRGAWQEGRRRALFAAAALATLIVLGSAIAGALRRSRRQRRATQAHRITRA